MIEKFITIAVLTLLVWEFQKRLSKVEASLLSIELRLRDKVDKPTELEKRMEERNKQSKA